jgi:hypothetical protein
MWEVCQSVDVATERDQEHHVVPFEYQLFIYQIREYNEEEQRNY